jgi:hypothetical protein
MGLRERLAHALFGDIIQDLVQQAGAVSVRIDDSSGWQRLSGGGPADRPWADKYSDLEDTLEAWQKNFFVRRLVTLTRSYAVAGGITITSEIPEVQAFIEEFWTHKQNRMDRRLGPICDEFTRAGEVFPVLFTNKVDGVSYVRFVPASRIQTIETDPDDYETELRYAQTREQTAEPKWWIGPGHRRAFKPYYNKLRPLMLHFAVNRPIGATRGESDLLPVLPWARRYSEWLKDRVRLNRIRTRQALLHIQIQDATQVEQKRQQIRTDNPIEKGIYVSGPDEEVHAYDLNIDASEAKEDGRALRLAIATGGNVGLHYMGEGESVNYATAKEMGEPTARFYAERQDDLVDALTGIVATAYRRFCVITGRDWPGEDQLQLAASAAEVARADNQSLAEAAKDVVTALAQMRGLGWIDDETAAKLAFKFAGEPLGDEEVRRILKNTEPLPSSDAGAERSQGKQEEEEEDS